MNIFQFLAVLQVVHYGLQVLQRLVSCGCARRHLHPPSSLWAARKDESHEDEAKEQKKTTARCLAD